MLSVDMCKNKCTNRKITVKQKNTMYLKFFEYSTKKDNVANFFVLFYWG